MIKVYSIFSISHLKKQIRLLKEWSISIFIIIKQGFYIFSWFLMKYSIIIPVHNGLKYLPTCIETIINQDYDNYELIISDDNSTDGTKEFLNSLKSNPNIKIVFTKKRLTVVEHFEWAYKHSCGEWVMFLGSDDGLQRYFFKLSDQLTKLAEENKLKIICPFRHNYF